MPSRPSRANQPFRLALPATSANLGPAFDAAALALNFAIKIRASESGNSPSSLRGATRKSVASSKITSF